MKANEQAAAATTGEVSDWSPQAMREVLHNLLLHQVELEMQNEELRRTQAALDTAQARYFDFYDLAPVGYVTVSEKAVILQANLTTAALLGVPRGDVIGKVFPGFLFAPDADRYYLMCRRTLTGGGVQSCELRIRKPDGDAVWVKLLAIAATADDGAAVIRMVLNDISERIQTEAVRQASQQFTNAILDSMPSQIAVLDSTGVILAVNAAWRNFALDNSATPGVPASHTAVGTNYLDICQSANNLDADEGATLARHGILRVIQGSAPIFQLEYPCHSPTQQRWFSMTVTPLNLDNHAVVVTHTDITERWQIEQAAKEASEHKFRLVADNTSDGIVTFNADRHIEYVSPAYVKQLGYSEAEELGRSPDMIYALIHPQDRDTVFAHIERAIASKETDLLYAYRVQHRLGHYIWREDSARFQYDASGRLSRACVVARDITERRRAEANLRENEEKLRGLYKLSRLGIARTDMKGQYVESNEAFRNICGYSAEELNSLDYWALTPTKYESEELRQLESLQSTGQYGPYEKEYIRKDGVLVPLQLNGSLITGADGQTYIWSIVEDITERKGAEQAVRRESARNEILLRNASDGIHILDSEGNLLEVSDAFCRMLGYAREELIGANVSLWNTHFSPQELKQVLAHHLAQEGLWTLETQYRRRDGSLLNVEITGQALELEGRRVLFNTARDITRRLQVDEELRIAAAAFQTQEAMMITDAKSVILKVNRAFSQVTGYPAEEAVGQTPRFLQSGRHNQDFYHQMWESVRNTGSWQGEVWDRHKDGREYPKWLSITAVFEGNGAVSHYIGSHFDLSERKRAELAMLEMNRDLSQSRQQLRELMSLNESTLETERRHIAREVHDELGQVLTALRMDMSLLRLQFGALDPALIGKTEDMKALVDRAIQGVRNVASSLRPAVLDMGLLPALDWLCNEFVRYGGCACALQTPHETIEVEASRAVVIFRIAQEALTNASKYARASQVSVRLTLHGNELTLAIHDNGIGFDPETVTKGSSLGLLGMRERALTLGGWVEIASKPGQGTVIVVVIPLDPGGAKDTA